MGSLRALGQRLSRRPIPQRLLLAVLLAPSVGVASPALASPPVTVRAAAPDAPVVLVFGDSLSAGYGIRVERGWVSLLALRLGQPAYGFRVVNASVSGETTAGGLARLPRALDLQRPRVLILELGGNDGLRGLSLSLTRDNLAQMIRLSRAHGAAVLLVGMRVPPNYGERYADGFRRLFTELARRLRVPLVPFLLDGVALNPALMQADGLHPNEAAQPLLLATVWPTLEPLLREARAHTAAASGNEGHP